MTVCKWCASSTDAYEGPARTPGWTRWRCTDCGAIGYQVDPEPVELSVLYEEAWRDAGNAGTFAAGSTSEKIAASLIKAIGGVPGSCHCLDYGGGNGAFAAALVRAGASHVSVFEPYGENPRIPNVNWFKSLDDLPVEPRFELIFLVEVIEHLLNPEGELRKLRERLAPGGKLVITTPNSMGWRGRLEGARWREAQNPTHINLFSLRALRACLQRSGFSPVRRVRKSVQYKATGVAHLALAVTQLLGIDGGLRVIASVEA